jgi:hypothetical protein
MAHFSTMLLFDQVKGPEQRIEFAKRIEARYGDNRQKDAEKPLVKTDGSRPGDTTVMYDKGGWVFWMLLNHMGRERALAGLQEFIREYSTGPDHAVLQDFVRVMRRHAPDVEAYDAFVAQWFFDVVVPEYKIHGVKAEKVSESAGAPGDEMPTEQWAVTFEIENLGTGVMPVELAAIRGERFPKEKEGPARTTTGEGREADAVVASAGDAEAGEAEAATVKTYQESKVVVTIGAGEKRTVTITAPFKPEKVIVDPDAKVLQLNRDQAVAEA